MGERLHTVTPVQTSGRASARVPPRGIAGEAARSYTWAAAVVTVLGLSLGYSSIGFGLLFFGALWNAVRTRRIPWVRTPLDVPLAVFGVVLLASAAASPYPQVALGVTLMLLISGAVYFGAFASVLRCVPAGRDRLLRAWGAGAVLAAFTGLVYRAVAAQFGTPDTMQGRAEIPRGVGPNGLGTTLMLGGIVCAALALKAERGERLLWLGGGLCCLAGLLASGSRASLAGWIVGVAYTVWRELRGKPRHMAAVAAAGLVLVAAAGAAIPQFAGRLPHTLSDVNGNRVRIWKTSLAMIADHPLLGTGFGTFERAYDRRRPPSSSPEPFAFNLWLNVAVETGVLGLAAALWIALRAVCTWRRRTAAARAPGTGVPADVDVHAAAVLIALWAGLLVDQLADNTLFSISTSAVLWLLLALVAVPSALPRLSASGRSLPDGRNGASGVTNVR